MILPFSIKILIRIYTSSPLFTRRASLAVLYLFLCLSFLFSFYLLIENKKATITMRVHPVPTKKRNNIAIQYYDMNTNGNLNNSRNPQNLSVGYHKKLRRLPHIFTRVLELPFRSDADVAVEESPDCFKFVAETDGIGEVRAHMIQIHPGVTKIVVRPNGFVELSSLDELELDMWRFRLPESTRPELASAVYEDGELIVTVPKGADLEGLEQRDGSGGGDGVGGGENGEFRGGMGNNRLVLVQ
ncbi:Heat shock 22 kDa protein [Melia azedarach]|uniref:Heat shock 22 kDa protein n=1 Tax=Melia azedarach TaxID=155640 RepID=A0ACC1YFA4_MELAZ|nr:Heat shock 22 kDa protein [Melia azedarach]